MKVAIKHDDIDLKRMSFSPEEEKTMREFITISLDTWTWLVDGEIVCVWGVVPPSILSDQAYLWLYTDEKVKEHQFLFVRHSQMETKRLLKEYKMITGNCVVGATKSIRWLKWLGAEFGEPEGQLIPFKIKRKQHG